MPLLFIVYAILCVVIVYGKGLVRMCATTLLLSSIVTLIILTLIQRG